MAIPPAVVLCFDLNFADIAAVSTYSIAKHGRSGVKIYWITPESDLAAVQDKIKKAKRLNQIEIKLLGAAAKTFSGWKTTYHFTEGMYLRFLIANLISEKRIIYLDADTLVLSDLSALYSMDIGANVVAGVRDPRAGLESRIPRATEDPYINSGVLLFDLEALRRDNMLERSIRIYQQYHEEATWPDQCIINKYAENRKLVLPDRWNVRIFANLIKESEFIKIVSITDPAILHFVGPVKPWQEWCNPFISDFWWNVARELEITTLKKQPITNIAQAIAFARSLDLSERYQQASIYKDRIIKVLMNS